jgi:TRAP-type mannitol/chloroaromatic compound transport system permease large subunit
MTILTLQIVLQVLARMTNKPDSERAMSDLTLGALYGAVTLVVMFSGMPIAFALGVVATGFMYFFMPASSLDTITQNVYEEMASITLLSIPLFILKGAAIGKSPAGKDLYSAIHTWMHKVPGGLGIANVFACALFAAMAGSSPATCSAIGSAGIPEMRKRGYSPGFAAGIIAAGGTLGILLPPSITMILYAVAAEQSLGRLFLAGIGPGVLLVALFAGYACTAPARNTSWRWHLRADRREVGLPGRRALHAGAEGRDAAARAALHRAADRRDDRAVRRLRHAVRNGGPGRAAGAGADRRGLRRLAAEGPVADPDLDDQGIDHAAADHRHVAALFLRDELPAHQPVGRAVGGRPCTCRNGCCWR